MLNTAVNSTTRPMAMSALGGWIDLKEGDRFASFEAVKMVRNS
jgi:hypothetical protein